MLTATQIEKATEELTGCTAKAVWRPARPVPGARTAAGETGFWEIKSAAFIGGYLIASESDLVELGILAD